MVDYDLEYQINAKTGEVTNITIVDAKTGMPLFGEAHKEACRDIMKHIMEENANG